MAGENNLKGRDAVTETQAGTPYTVPDAPEGTTLIIRSRCLKEGGTELKKVGPGATGTYSILTPMQWFSAFDDDANHLGSWSPLYQSMGWEKSDGMLTLGAAAEELLRVNAVRRYRGDDQAILDARRWWRSVNDGRTVISTWGVP